MKIQPYVDKLNASPEYKKFAKKYKDAFLVAGFFVLDFEAGKNVHQIDFYIPSEKKFAAFTVDGGVSVQILDTMNDSVPEKLDINTNIDLDALQGILEDEMKNRNMTEDIKKIIAVLQTIKGKKVWNINSVLSGMEILKAHVEDSSQTILKMEKTSISDIMKKIPMEQMQAMKDKFQAKGKMQTMPTPGAIEGAGAGESEEMEDGGEESEEEEEEEIKKLDLLETKIKEEKERIKKDMLKNGKGVAEKKDKVGVPKEKVVFERKASKVKKA